MNKKLTAEFLFIRLAVALEKHYSLFACYKSTPKTAYSSFITPECFQVGAHSLIYKTSSFYSEISL